MDSATKKGGGDLEFTEPHELDPCPNNGEAVFNYVHLPSTEPTAYVKHRLRLPRHFDLLLIDKTKDTCIHARERRYRSGGCNGAMRLYSRAM